jgi:hypothetical protein
MPVEAPETIAGELDVIDEPTVTAPGLFGTDNPKLVVARAVEVADELARVIRAKHLSVRIGRKEHVLVEGWTLLGTMLGVFPVLEWSRPLDDGWEARVEAKTLDGRIVGAAESECLRAEARWAKADDYAVRSMAATRATSKALRQPLGFVMHLAGFDVTPAEEMPTDDPQPKIGSRVAPAEPSKEQITEIRELIDRLTELDPETDWVNRCRDIAGVTGDMLTHGGAVIVIEKLRDELAQRQERAGGNAAPQGGRRD